MEGEQAYSWYFRRFHTSCQTEISNHENSLVVDEQIRSFHISMKNTILYMRTIREVVIERQLARDSLDEDKLFPREAVSRIV